MAQITIFEGTKYGADYIMSFYLVLCGANYQINFQMWRKLNKYFFLQVVFGANYIRQQIIYSAYILI